MEEKQLLLVIGGAILDHSSPEDLMQKMVQFFEDIEERKHDVITEVSEVDDESLVDEEVIDEDLMNEDVIDEDVIDDKEDEFVNPNQPKEMGPYPLSSEEQAVMETLKDLLQPSTDKAGWNVKIQGRKRQNQGVY